MTVDDLHGKTGFAVGTGRCGTHFIAKLLEHEPMVAASHEREPMLQTFHRYCKWNELPVDHQGYLRAMELRIRRDLNRRPVSFESSGHLSLSIRELDERFAPKWVFLVRNPYDTVKSYVQKGWYLAPMVQAQPELALGYQEHAQFHHFLGRIAPRGKPFVEWNVQSRVGKTAWFWATLNRAVLDQAEAIPRDRWRTVKLEELDHTKYVELARFVGFEPQLTEERFAEIRNERPGAQKMQPIAWGDTEWQEFEAYVTPVARTLGYDVVRKR